MKNLVLTISLIALVAIVFSSCSGPEREYVFEETTIIFDPNYEVLDPTSWSLKEKSPNRTIRYFFQERDIHNDLEDYTINPKIKNKINSSVYSDSLEFELIKKRAKMWVRKIDSVNRKETRESLEELKVPNY